ncbi:hypothetical protein ACN27F_28685 [Solwaraspora sp. WMMB335]|uniref:hypothetical protein n=1 Tax=Solwaraspora sp. WMMB335 TaxID=3404118 RepID=UPI003B9605D2
MGLFRRAPRSLFPADMPQWLDRFGRFSLDPQGCGLDVSEMARGLWTLRDYATSDPDGFLAELSVLARPDRGGFATYGAAFLAWEMYLREALRMPAALPLIDAGIRFKLSRGLPTAMLTGFEKERLEQLRPRNGGQPPPLRTKHVDN